MIDLEPIISAAQEALKTRNLNELFGEEGYAKRGTDGLNQFGWSRLYKILNAALRLGQRPGAICGTACDPRFASTLPYGLPNAQLEVVPEASRVLG